MTCKIGLRFPEHQTREPIISRMVRKYDVVFSILRARVGEGLIGQMVLELTGTEEAVLGCKQFLREQGLTVVQLPESITIDRERCMECGACTSACRPGALTMSASGDLSFDNALCVLCGACKPACPVSAIALQDELVFD